MSYSYDDIVDALESVAQYGVPSPGAAPIIDVGTADFLSLFENEILGTLLDSGGGTCRIYEGVYGSGKTHFLDLVTTLALRKGMAVVRNDLSQGVNLDNWETHDTRSVIDGIGITIEPGVYLPEFGVRSEINVFMGPDGPEITSAPQKEVLTTGG